MTKSWPKWQSCRSNWGSIMKTDMTSRFGPGQCLNMLPDCGRQHAGKSLAK